MASPPRSALADELDDVLRTFRAQRGKISWSRLDDANDALLSGLIALFAACTCFIQVGLASEETQSKIAGVDAAFFLVFFILTLLFHRFLRTFPTKQRIRTVTLLIARLRDLSESPGDASFACRFQQKRNVNFCTATKRGEIWRNVPNNLLVKGDLVALPSGRRAPAKVTRVADGKVTQRDEILSAALPRPEESNLEFLSLMDVEEYRVMESPLVFDVAQFLDNSERAQETAIGRQIESISKLLRIGAGIGFLVFGIALQTARYVVRPDQYTFDVLILMRSATLIMLVPCLSWPGFRFLFEYYSFTRMQKASQSKLKWWPSNVPLMPSTLVRVLGSVTALCGLDEDTLLLDSPAVEEVFLLKGGKKTQVIDCCLDETGKFGLRFEDPQWRSHFSSLKPLGLACALAGNDSSSGEKKQLSEGEASLVKLFQQRIIPRHLSQLSSTMGFRHEDVQGFTVRARCTVLGQQGSIPSSSIYPASHLLARPIVECLIVEVPQVAPPPPPPLSSIPPPPAISRTLSVQSEHGTTATAAHPAVVPPLNIVTNKLAISGGMTSFKQITPEDKTKSLSIKSASSTSNLPSLQQKHNPLPAAEQQLPKRSASSSSLHQPALTSKQPSPSANDSSVPSPLVKSSSSTGLVTPKPTSSSSTGAKSVATVKHAVPSSSSAKISAGGNAPTALHILCWGNAHLMLQFCAEYWDGESIWSLDEETRKQVERMTMQWDKEDFDCVAFAYGPLSTPGFGDKSLFLSSPFVDDVFVVSPSTLPKTPRSQTPPQASSSPLFPPTKHDRHEHHHHSSSSSMLTPSLDKMEVQERRMQIVCANLAKGLIFTGMTGSRDQPKTEVNSLVEHLHRCGIRFVYFSPREARCGRKIADKMGLETDWNTSISLASPNQFSPPHPQVRLRASGTSSYHELYGDWEQKTRMPKGVEAIKRHIVEVDDVPLRVSVFTECVPGTVAEMIEVMRDRNEVVAVFGTPLAGINTRAYLRSNVSIAVDPEDVLFDDEMKLSADFGRLSCSFRFGEKQSGVLLTLLGEGRIALYNYRQANQCFIALGLAAFVAQLAVFCSSSPDMFTIGHTLWLVWVIIPLLSCPAALRPRKHQSMLWERMPWKQSALVMIKDNPTKRYVIYAVVRLLPVAGFVSGMFFWTLISLDENARSTLNWSSTSKSFDPTAVQAAQSLAMLAFVWCGSFVAASFASRTETEKDLELNFWAIWVGFVVLSVGLQLAYNCVLSSIVIGSCSAGAFPSFPAQPSGEVWLVLLLCPPIFVPLFALPVKRHDRVSYNRAMQMMRLDFETKLGQFSPK